MRVYSELISFTKDNSTPEQRDDAVLYFRDNLGRHVGLLKDNRVIDCMLVSVTDKDNILVREYVTGTEHTGNIYDVRLVVPQHLIIYLVKDTEGEGETPKSNLII
jgi:hypothetical protein